MKKIILLISLIFVIACKKNYTDNSTIAHNNYNINTEKKIYYLVSHPLKNN
jgi:thioredoxin-related protein